MKRKVILPGIFVLILLSLSPVYAGRPLGTEDSATAGKGKVILEMGQEWVEQKNGDKESCQSYVLSFGLTENMDLVVEKPYMVLRPMNDRSCAAIADTVVAIKYRFTEETDHSPSVGVKAFADLKDGDENGTSGETEYGANFFVSKDLGGVTAHGNVGYTLVNPREGTTRDDIINYSVALEKPIGEKWVLVGEVLGESSRNESGPAAAQLGVTYQLSPSVTLDTGYSWGINKAAHKNSVTIGVTIGF